MTTFAELQQFLFSSVRSLGATVEEAPTQWTSNVFNTEVLSSGFKETVGRNERDLPKVVAAARLDDIPVLIGELGGISEITVVNDIIRRYRNQATITRSWLGHEAPNLQLFLIGPDGALGDIRWRQLAANIESDDRVCRKLVWLYSKTPDKHAAAAFLERTFVARPWIGESTDAVTLDKMSELSLPSGWEPAIDNLDLDTDSLVNYLIDLEPESGL